jgi:hypothetical protein
MKRLFLVEDYPQDFEPRGDDTVVALSAKACYFLERHGYPYQTAVDRGVERLLDACEDEYWKDQLNWFDQLDEAILGASTEYRPRIGPAILFGYHLKALVDGVFMSCQEAKALLREPCDRVMMWPDRARSPGPWAPDSSVNARLWPLICARRNIPYVECSVASVRGFGNGRPSVRRFGRMKRIAQGAVECADYLALWKAAVRSPAPPARSLTLLFLQRQYDCGDLLREALRDGHRCLVLEKHGHGVSLVDFTPAATGRGWPRLHSLRSESAEGAAIPDWNALAGRLLSPNSPIWDWPKSVCGMDVHAVLNSELHDWLVRKLPPIVQASAALAAILKRENVDYVLTSALVNDAQLIGVSAAHQVNRTATVLIAHGEGPCAAKVWDLHELYPHDQYFVANEESAAYFRGRAVSSGRRAARVHVGSERWRHYAQLAKRPRAYVDRWDGGLPIRVNRPPGNVPMSRPIVLYVCSQTEGDFRYMHSSSYHFEAWYYQLQTHIVRALAAVPGYTFVLKLYPDKRADYEAIRRFVVDLGSPNIHVSRAPLTLWLPWAGRVILDRPSTTLYQVALSGVGFHLLLYRRLPMRPAALQPFEGHLTRFDTFEEAAAAVQSYLKKKDAGTVALMPSDSDILTTLTELSAAERSSVDNPPTIWPNRHDRAS